MTTKSELQERRKLRKRRKEVIRAASVNESGTRIEHLANLMLIDSFNRDVRKFKTKVKRND